MDVAINEYDAKIDTKKRITLRGSLFEYYHVTEYPSGEIKLEPRELVPPFQISENSLKMMDESMCNMSKGKVSDPIDLSEFED